MLRKKYIVCTLWGTAFIISWDMILRWCFIQEFYPEQFERRDWRELDPKLHKLNNPSELPLFCNVLSENLLYAIEKIRTEPEEKLKLYSEMYTIVLFEQNGTNPISTYGLKENIHNGRIPTDWEGIPTEGGQEKNISLPTLSL